MSTSGTVLLLVSFFVRFFFCCFDFIVLSSTLFFMDVVHMFFGDVNRVCDLSCCYC